MVTVGSKVISVGLANAVGLGVPFIPRQCAVPFLELHRQQSSVSPLGPAWRTCPTRQGRGVLARQSGKTVDAVRRLERDVNTRLGHSNVEVASDGRRSVLLRARNRSPRAACRSLHSKFRHRPIRRPDARHSSGCKVVAARRQLSGRATDAISFSSVCLFPVAAQDVNVTRASVNFEIS